MALKISKSTMFIVNCSGFLSAKFVEHASTPCLNLNVYYHFRALQCVNFTSKSLSILNMQRPISMAEFGK